MGDVRLGVGRVAKTWVWAGFGQRSSVAAGGVGRSAAPRTARDGGATEAGVSRKGGLFRLRAPCRWLEVEAQLLERGGRPARSPWQSLFLVRLCLVVHVVVIVVVICWPKPDCRWVTYSSTVVGIRWL